MKKLSIVLALVVLVAAVLLGIQAGQKNTAQQQAAELEDKLKLVDADLVTAKEQTTELEDKLKLADTDLATAKEQVAELEGKLKQADTDLAAAKEQVADLEAAAVDAAKLSADLALLQGSYDTLLQEKDGIAVQAEEANKVVKALTEERTTLAGQIAEDKKTIASLTDERTTLTTQLEEAQKAHAALTQERDDLSSRLDSVMAAMDADKASLEAEVDKASKRADTLQTKLDESNKTVTALEEEKKALEADVEKAQESADALTAEKAALQNQVDESNKAVTALEEEKKALEADVEKAQESADALTAEKAALQTQVDESNKAVTALEEEKKALEADVEKAQESANALTADKDAMQNQLDEAAKQVQALEDEKASLEAKLGEAQKSTDALEAEKALLEEQLRAQTDQKAEPVAITVFHTNDVHSRIEGNDKDLIGYAKLAAIVKDARAAGGVLLLDAGDVLHGMSLATMVQGQSIVDMMNLVGYDAMTPGNHDFNYGYDRLKELEEGLDCDMVNANIVLENGDGAFKPFVIKEVSGKKIAIVGGANPQIKSAIHPNHTKGLQFLGVEKIEEAVRQADAEADAVIVLAHWGADKAYEPNSSVLAKIKGVDLVIDGHSHTLLGDIEQVEGGALIVSAGEYLKNIGKVIMTFDEKGEVTCQAEMLTYEMTADVVPDEDVLSAIEAIKASQEEILSIVIGTTDVFLDGERETNRTGETNLGDLAADGFLAYTDADFAFTNGGGIRKSIEQGDITKQSVVDVFPFGNTIVIIEVTGEKLLAAMEHGLRLYPEQNGGFPQIAGGTLVFDPAKDPGSRVVSMTVGGQDVDPAKAYKVATNDFLAAGGDGYEMLKDCPVLQYRGTLDEAFTEYIDSLGIITLEKDGRIARLDEEAGEAQPAATQTEEVQPEEVQPEATQTEAPADAS
ncbi:MAG: 5'-nucleotidase C-terminal domain-containing protein [Christensenellales bacterium]|jgi:5'-nucleotidase/UDP-sugar diphosphatase